MKKSIYFPLHTTHYSSVKSLNIRMNYDFAGYALYVMLWQKLAETSTRSITLNQIPALAFDFRCDKTLLTNIINDGFTIDNDCFYSEELNENLAWYDEKYNKASEGGKKAAANMTPVQRKQRAENAINSRWQKDENTKSILSTKNEILTTKNEILTPLVSDTNNININRNINRNREKIEIEKNGNKIEMEIETKKEKNFPLIFSDKGLDMFNDYYLLVKNNFKLNIPINKFEKIVAMVLYGYYENTYQIKPSNKDLNYIITTNRFNLCNEGNLLSDKDILTGLIELLRNDKEMLSILNNIFELVKIK